MIASSLMCVVWASCLFLVFSDLKKGSLPAWTLTLLGGAIGGHKFLVFGKEALVQGVFWSFAVWASLLILLFLFLQVKGKAVLGGGDLKLIPLLVLGLESSMLPFFLILSGVLGVFSILFFYTRQHPPFAPALIFSYGLTKFFYA